MLEHVLKTQFWKYEKGDLFRTVLGPLIGAGIFGADGQVKERKEMMFWVFRFGDWEVGIKDSFGVLLLF